MEGRGGCEGWDVEARVPRNPSTANLWTKSLLGLSPVAQRRWRRRTLIALAWLCIGAAVNVLVAWGCVWYGETKAKQRIVRGIHGEPRVWPFDAGTGWRPPTGIARCTARGYVKVLASEYETTFDYPEQAGLWRSTDGLKFDPQGPRAAGVFRRVVAHNVLFSSPPPMLDVEASASSTIHRVMRHDMAGWPMLSLESRSANAMKEWYGSHKFDFAVVGTRYIVGSPVSWALADAFDSGIPEHYLPSFIRRGSGLDSFPVRPLWPGFALNTLLYAAIGWSIVRAFLSSLWFVIRHRRSQRGLCVACKYPVRGLAVCPECGRGVVDRVGSVAELVGTAARK